jgi:hypothetical protein
MSSFSRAMPSVKLKALYTPADIGRGGLMNLQFFRPRITIPMIALVASRELKLSLYLAQKDTEKLGKDSLINERARKQSFAKYDEKDAQGDDWPLVQTSRFRFNLTLMATSIMSASR